MRERHNTLKKTNCSSLQQKNGNSNINKNTKNDEPNKPQQQYSPPSRKLQQNSHSLPHYYPNKGGLTGSSLKKCITILMRTCLCVCTALFFLMVIPPFFKISSSSAKNYHHVRHKAKGAFIPDMRLLGYEARPKVLHFSYNIIDKPNNNNGTGELSSSSINEAKNIISFHINPYEKLYPSKRVMDISSEDIEKENHLLNSKDYKRGMRDPFAVGQCQAQYKWQEMSYPTCNNLHEVEMTGNSVQLINNGYWRDVWVFEETASGIKQVLKTLRYEHDWEDRNYDRHRRDALAMERLSSSPHIVDIYSFCGNSGFTEYSEEGDLDDLLWNTRPASKRKNSEVGALLSPLNKVKIALQLAMALADVHNIDKEGVASIAHTDITSGQFIMVGGIFKLNDFNRCRFIRWNKWTGQPCGYKVGRNPGKFRSPEEYRYDKQTEMVDVYSMGNIYYQILTYETPFAGTKEKAAKKMIMDGERAPVPKEIEESEDPFIQLLLEAMRLCWIQDKNKRASARDIEMLISEKLDELSRIKKAAKKAEMSQAVRL